jgi:hypothetical protein
MQIRYSSMTKLLPSILFLVLALQSQAQLVKRFTIYFDNNASALTKAHQLRLDSFITSLPNIPEAFIADVKGHTDQVGSLELNTALSKNRAVNVMSYFKKKNFTVADSGMHYYAYSKPDPANTADNSVRNRRVEISIYTRKLDMPKILAIKDFKPRIYKFNEDEGGTLSYDSTKIMIPANAFTRKDGSEVSGFIEISYTEFRNPSDFILSGIPMSVETPDGFGHFNSGGMLDLKAFQNKEELLLKTASDKTIQMKFPLSNVIDQRFYQFDSTRHAWNSNSQPITNMHGNLIAPFGTQAMTGNPNGDSDPGYYYACLSGKDTCAQIMYMVAKLNYFLAHEEPIRRNYPYKFIKNHTVDFKSPYYKVSVDQKNNTVEFIPMNSHNKLGVFSDYIWSYEGKDYEKQISKKFDNGCSFVKVIPSGGLRFKLNIDGQVVILKGKPKEYANGPKKTLFSFLQTDKQKLYETQLKKVNRKNGREYTRYIKKLDSEERELENTLKKEEDLSASFTFDDKYCADSLRCMDYFYKGFLYNRHPSVYGVENFNLNRDVLAEKLKQFAKPFTRADAQRLMVQKDSADKAIFKIRKENRDNTQKVFAKFGISATGVYNADQIKNIIDPQEILAQYETENGKPLKIISVSVTIKGLNGVICYDGHYGYGPYRFVCGKSDTTMLIAIDAGENAYYCSPQEFERFTKNRGNNKATFILKPLKNLETKSELEKIVAK